MAQCARLQTSESVNCEDVMRPHWDELVLVTDVCPLHVEAELKC